MPALAVNEASSDCSRSSLSSRGLAWNGSAREKKLFPHRGGGELEGGKLGQVFGDAERTQLLQQNQRVLSVRVRAYLLNVRTQGSCLHPDDSLRIGGDRCPGLIGVEASLGERDVNPDPRMGESPFPTSGNFGPGRRDNAIARSIVRT